MSSDLEQPIFFRGGLTAGTPLLTPPSQASNNLENFEAIKMFRWSNRPYNFQGTENTVLIYLGFDFAIKKVTERGY